MQHAGTNSVRNHDVPRSRLKIRTKVRAGGFSLRPGGVGSWPEPRPGKRLVFTTGKAHLLSHEGCQVRSQLSARSLPLRGSLHPGTYTEKDLIRNGIEVAAVDIAGKKRASGLKRAKFVVKSVTSMGVHEDVMTKRGSTRADKIVGDLELVIGDGSDQVTISATMN